MHHRHQGKQLGAATAAAALAIITVLAAGSPVMAAKGGKPKPTPTTPPTSTGSSAPEQACAAVVGSFSGNPTGNWQCDYPPTASTGVPDQRLVDACPWVSVYMVGGSRRSSMVYFACS